MLILSRHVGESVVLRERATGREIGRVLVAELDRGWVRLGFTFPADVVVDREEVDERKRGGKTP